MLLIRLLLPFVVSIIPTAADSLARNSLEHLSRVQRPEIHAINGHVNAFSHFDLSFALDQPARQFRLTLEPNHNVLPSTAHVSYLDKDGKVSHSEPLVRRDYRVYKGTAQISIGNGESWRKTGWARLGIHSAGTNPLFEGAFSVDGDVHHIQLASTYMQHRQPLDPQLETVSDDSDYMIVFRDSDIAPNLASEDFPDELRRRGQVSFDSACRSNELDFNKRLHNHKKHKTRERDAHLQSLANPFFKRQLDTQPGTGGTGYVNYTATIGDSSGCPSSNMVALVGVATDCNYTSLFPNNKRLRHRVMHLMNLASNVWEDTFNISLGLANLTISPSECPGGRQAATPWNQNCNSGLDMQDRLNLFSGWRGEQSDGNSHWTLLTTCRTGQSVGLAWLSQACVRDVLPNSGPNETVSGANVVATTGTEWQVIAHETGHTFGAVHDCDSSACAGSNNLFTEGQCCPLSPGGCDAGSNFIMNPYTTRVNSFSPCTVGNVCSAIGSGYVNTQCLSVNQGITTITGQQCGNGIVEEGEDCDCGGDEECAGNSCCNPQTCKFANGAVCDDANQDCCNNCQFAAKNNVCRPSRGVCDPEEKCPGNAALCPEDETAENGRSCSLPNAPNGAGDLTCASGRCTSRNLQCINGMSAYPQRARNPFACDDDSCVLSCGSESLGPNTCVNIAQNMLDGTPCGGGGHCENGRCQGTNFGQEVASWVQDHKEVVIGIAVGVGLLVIFFIGSCICGCTRRRRREKALAKAGPPPAMAGRRAPPPPPPGGWYGPQTQAPPVRPVPPPAPPHTAPMWQASPQSPGAPGPTFPSHETHQGWRPPQSPVPGPGPLYGNGILGAPGRHPNTPPPVAAPMYGRPPPANFYGGDGLARQTSPRYA